jgi:LmbE family N-acetylglucosaminyl deacetylase
MRETLKKVRDWLVRIMYRAFCLCADDIAPFIESHSSMIIAPHPDDEVLGSGVAMIRARQKGQFVSTVIVTDGRAASPQSTLISPDEIAALRRGEALKANAALGIAADNVHFLNFRDNETSNHIDEIAAALRVKIEQVKPQLIFIPHDFDKHPDHRSVVVAVEKLMVSGVIRCRVFQYAVWIWPFGALRSLLHPRRYLKLRRIGTEGWIAQKRAALAAYRSQCENLTGEKNWHVLPKYFFDLFFTRYELYFEK